MRNLDRVFDPDRAAGFTVPVSVGEHLRRSETDDANGTVPDPRDWYIELAEHLAAVTAAPGETPNQTDERVAELLAEYAGRQLRHGWRLTRCGGEQPDAELRRWLEQLPAALRTKLAVALDALPDLGQRGAERAKATGTDDACARVSADFRRGN